MNDGEEEITFGVTDPPGWTDIVSIRYEFAPHYNKELKDSEVHKDLTKALGETIEDIDDLFETEERLALKRNALEILRNKIVLQVTSEASMTTRVDRIAPVLNSLPLIKPIIETFQGRGSSTTETSIIKIKNSARLLQVFEYARNKRMKIPAIQFEIGSLRITKGRGFDPFNFDTIGNVANPPLVEGTTDQPDQRPVTTDMVNVAAIETIMASLGDKFNISPKASDDIHQRTNTDKTPVSMGVENYNVNSLPTDVRDRVNMKNIKQDRVMTRDDMKPFISLTPNMSQDSTGMTMRREMYHFIVPDKIITRDGTFFKLNVNNKTIDKRFTNNAPTVEKEQKITPETIRSWYKDLLKHCVSNGVYLHPYYCFRQNVNHKNGFTFGTDTDSNQFDLPLTVQYELSRWTGLIGQALKDAFPSDTSQRRICETNATDGYAAIRKILYADHPTFIEYGSTLAMTQPVQEKNMDIYKFHQVYKDYLELRAFTENNPTSLDDFDQMTKFIACCKWGYEILNLQIVRIQRKSPDVMVRDRWTAEEIVFRMQEMLEHIDKSIPPFRNMKVVRRMASPSNSPVKTNHSNQHRSNKRSFDSRHRKPNPKKPVTSRAIVKVNKLYDMDDLDQIASKLPTEFDDDDTEGRIGVTIYKMGISNVKSMGSFDTSQKCLVCSKPGHTFEDCPVLNNHQLLKDIHIQFCSSVKRIQNKITQAATTTAIHNIDVANDSESSDEDARYYLTHDSSYEPSDFW